MNPAYSSRDCNCNGQSVLLTEIMQTTRNLRSNLIRERCTYPVPMLEAPPKPASQYEWKFEDRFGNRHGRLRYRLSEAAKDDPWVDVFDQDVHQSEFHAGFDFALVAITDGHSFTIYRVTPPDAPLKIFRQKQKLQLHGLSFDQKFFLVQSAQNENWFQPELLVLDLYGHVLARMGNFESTVGCWAGAWAPVADDYRIVFQHEMTGYFQPAIWSPFENRTENLPTGLEGEVFATWDRTAQALILKRCLNGKSDLHRLKLDTRKIENLQPLDGVIWHHEFDEKNRVIGILSSGHRYAEHFCEHERRPFEEFSPTAALNAWRFRTIAGVPCFVMDSSSSGATQWTIFDGYGSYPYHHSDSYHARMQAYADHGFQVVLVNTRGCGGFGRTWREATRGKPGFTELEDMRQVRGSLVEEGSVDGDRTIIAGDSWGGYMALLAMGTQPELWKMGVAFAPIGDFVRLASEGTPIEWAVTRSSFCATPDTLETALQKASPLTYVDSIRSPILILAGKHDLLCPPNQNRAFVEAVRARGGLCDMYLFEGGHAPPNREEKIRSITLILEFLLNHSRAFDANVR